MMTKEEVLKSNLKKVIFRLYETILEGTLLLENNLVYILHNHTMYKGDCPRIAFYNIAKYSWQIIEEDFKDLTLKENISVVTSEELKEILNIPLNRDILFIHNNKTILI